MWSINGHLRLLEATVVAVNVNVVVVPLFLVADTDNSRWGGLVGLGDMQGQSYVKPTQLQLR